MENHGTKIHFQNEQLIKYFGLSRFTTFGSKMQKNKKTSNFYTRIAKDRLGLMKGNLALSLYLLPALNFNLLAQTVR